MEWQPVDTAPYATNVLAWLYLPKNPIASAHVIAQRVFVEKDEPESYGEFRLTVGCWWANGRYYPAGYITHWMPLPKPPLSGVRMSTNPDDLTAAFLKGYHKRDDEVRELKEKIEEAKRALEEIRDFKVCHDSFSHIGMRGMRNIAGQALAKLGE